MHKVRRSWATYGLLMAGGYCTFRTLRTALRMQTLRGKIVLITGGTKGLGMVLARDFALAGARVAICARSVAELEEARSWIHKEAAAAILAVPCDVSQPEDVDRMVKHVQRVYGPIDILINNNGAIAVAPWDVTGVEDFESAQFSMFFGMLHPTRAVLPATRAAKKGQIVTITSIGAMISIPHLLVTKLKSEGITVTTILRGLIRTGSYGAAEFKRQKKAEYKRFSRAASLPFVSLSADRASRKILSAVVNRESFCILGIPAQIAARIYANFPAFALHGLALINRFLPAHEAGEPPTPEPVGLRVLKGPAQAAVQNYQT